MIKMDSRFLTSWFPKEADIQQTNVNAWRYTVFQFNALCTKLSKWSQTCVFFGILFFSFPFIVFN